jgi:gluconolactonase
MTAQSLSSIHIFGEGVVRSEGIVIDKDGYVYGAGRNGSIYKVSPDDKVEEIAKLPTGSVPNGIALDLNGDLIICDIGKGAVVRLTQSGHFSLIADRVEDVPLAVPNFATFDAEGNLFVSNTINRPMRDWSKKRPDMHETEPTGALVCIRPDGRGTVVARDLHWANGTAIDPKEEAVYVLQTNRHDCLRIPINKDGGYGKPEIYSDNFPACPDGMAFAANGTLFITLPGSIRPPGSPPGESLLETRNQIISVGTNGEWKLLVEDKTNAKFHNPTNCAFGGPDMRDLYFSNLLTDHFCKTRSDFAGHPLYHQR